MAETPEEPEDTNEEMEPRAKRPHRAGTYLWPAGIASAVAVVSQATVGGYQLGSRDATLEKAIMNQVRLEFVTKDTSENRSDILSADIASIRAALVEIKETARGIPRLEAQIEVLKDQVARK